MRTLLLSLAISLTALGGLSGCDDKTPATEGQTAETHLCPMHCVPAGIPTAPFNYDGESL